MKPSPLHLALARHLFTGRGPEPSADWHPQALLKKGLSFFVKMSTPNAPLRLLPRSAISSERKRSPL